MVSSDYPTSEDDSASLGPVSHPEELYVTFVGVAIVVAAVGVAAAVVAVAVVLSRAGVYFCTEPLLRLYLNLTLILRTIFISS
jgi:hypothetical protein